MTSWICSCLVNVTVATANGTGCAPPGATLGSDGSRSKLMNRTVPKGGPGVQHFLRYARNGFTECLQNFFAYMMQHYDIDGLIEYGAQSLPGTLLVINPAWRELEKAVKKARHAERQQQARWARHTLDDAQEIQKKAESVEALQAVQEELKQLRLKRKATPKKVRIDSLPEDQRPTELLPLSKMLSDTVKMIAYRAETALVALLRRHLTKEAEARALVRELFVSAADIEPDDIAKTLTIKIHRMASPAHDKAVAALLDDLTLQAFCHPETGARMIYALV